MRKNFFLALVSFDFQACSAPTSCQRFLGTASRLNVFYFILFFINLHTFYH